VALWLAPSPFGFVATDWPALASRGSRCRARSASSIWSAHTT